MAGDAQRKEFLGILEKWAQTLQDGVEAAIDWGKPQDAFRNVKGINQLLNELHAVSKPAAQTETTWVPNYSIFPDSKSSTRASVKQAPPSAPTSTQAPVLTGSPDRSESAQETSNPTGAPTTTREQRLLELKTLFDKGLISKEQMEEKRTEILKSL